MKTLALAFTLFFLIGLPQIRNETLVGEPQPTLAQMILAMISGGK